MANKILAGISLFICVIALSAVIASFFAENWVNFEVGTEEREFGLFRQTDGFDSTVVASWYCNYVFYCEAVDEYSGTELYENIAQAWCDVGTQFWRGALIYYICYLVSFIFLTKYMLCCVSIILDRDPGKKTLMIGYVWLFMILSMVAFSAWWYSNSNVKYNGDCDNDGFTEDSNNGDRWEMCAGPGATICIVAFCSMLTAGVTGIMCTCMQNNLNEIKLAQEEDVGCLRLKRHFVLIYFFSVVCIALSLTTPLIRDWVSFNITQTASNRDDDFTGSLFALDEFYQSYQNNTLTVDYYAWDCIGGRSCEINNDSALCKTFEPLMDAGRIYFNMQITVSGLLILWHNFFGYSILYSREWGHPRLNHALPHLAWILHLAAVICWAVVSEVKFEMGECENKDTALDEQLDICIHMGPILAFVQLIIQIIFAIYFSAIYSRRGTSSLSNQDYNLAAVGVDADITPDTVSTSKTFKNAPTRQQLLPQNFPTVSTILTVDDANSAIELYTKAFQGKVEHIQENGGKTYHAEIKIGDSFLIVKDSNSQKKQDFVKDLNNNTGEVYIVLGNCASLYKECLKLGFIQKNKPQENQLTESNYRLECPFGHIFTLVEKKSAKNLLKLKIFKPCLVVSSTKDAVELYTKAFNGTLADMTEHQGTIVHAEMIIGTGFLVLAEKGPNSDMEYPIGNTSLEVMLAILEFEEQYSKCINHGFKSIQKPQRTKQGNRYAKLQDPFGYFWHLQAKTDVLSQASEDTSMYMERNKT